jgi:hypothetical protein
MHSTTARRLLLTSLVGAALVVVGCASDPYGWREKPDTESLPAVFVEVGVADLGRACGISHPNLHGCARRDFAARVCIVYTGPKPQPWLLTHELAHCAGWSHQ